MTDYKPISCSLHDVLESIAVLRETADIVYEDETGRQHHVKSHIRDIYSKSREEFLVLDDGTEIRLDRLRLVNEKWFGGSCILPEDGD